MQSPGVTGQLLIVEDDRNIASLVATYLQREGFSAATASDGENALQLARQPSSVSRLSLPRLRCVSQR